MSLSSLFFYKFLNQITSKKVSFMGVLLFAFCTNNLSINSGGLWQHTSGLLLLNVGLYLFYVKDKIINKKSIWKSYITEPKFLSFLFFGLATVARPTFLLPFVLFVLLYLCKYKNTRRSLSFLFIGLIPILVENLINLRLFESLKNTGYGSQTHRFTGNILLNYFGIWFSPSKGILTISPIFIFIFYTFGEVFKDLFKNFKIIKLVNLYTISFSTVLVHTLVISKWHDWYGGYSWGYRLSSDVLPFLVILLIPFLEKVKNYNFKNYNVIFKIFILLAFYSFAVQILGVLYYDGYWHGTFDNGPKDQGWLWNFNNNQVLFSVKRLLHKAKLIGDPFLNL